MALAGGLLHIPAHGFMKLTLFFCAGVLHVETHTDDISDMAGIGRRMPLTMGAFAVAAAGMAGIPLLAGFASKYLLLVGTVSAGDVAFTGALLLSGILNIAYFWPVVYTAFFEAPDATDPKPVVEGPLGGRFGADHRDPADVAADGGAPEDAEPAAPTAWEPRPPTGAETSWLMLGPVLLVAAGSVVLGIVPDAAVFLRVVRLIVALVTGVAL
jgi:NADH-quinone oxidoreductase subunit L/multicomponent Na+:H+ antiporter subunit D